MPPDYGACQPPHEDMLRTFSHSSGDQSVPLLREEETTYCIPKRYVFSMLSFTACCLAVSFNMNLSIAIVSMLIKTDEVDTLVPLVIKNVSAVSDGNELLPNVTPSLPTNKLYWGTDIESVALGAVYYGQLVSFIPGGRMAELYGGKKMLLICTLVGSLATLLGPVTAFWSPYAFIATRIAVGIGTGPIIPIVFYMLAKWIPQNERSFHASFILSGYGVGSFLAVIVSGALCGTSFLGGWPSVFYTGGTFGVFWCLICAYIMRETPDVHPTISDEELTYITNGIGSVKKEKIMYIPWKEMALSVPLWALAIGFFGQFWLLGFFSTVHALYMGTILQLPIVRNGVLSCLPHLLRAFATCIASYPVDIILKRRLVSVGFIRKGATVINTAVSCCAFLGITLVGRRVAATTVLFILGGILGEFVTFGVCMACIDIAPSLSGTVSGLINIVGVFPFFLIPALVGWITNYEDAIEKWRKVFYLTIAIVSVSTLIFVIFGDLSPQSWGVAPDLKTRKKSEQRESQEDKENAAGNTGTETQPKNTTAI